jgi:hypothetical protein
MNDDDIRGDRSNPAVSMQAEIGEVLDRYADVVAAKPGWVAALLVEYADTIRSTQDLEHEVEHVGDDIHLVTIDGSSGWVGAPRAGMYGDIDVEALDERLDAAIEADGPTQERAAMERGDLDE